MSWVLYLLCFTVCLETHSEDLRRFWSAHRSKQHFFCQNVEICKWGLKFQESNLAWVWFGSSLAEIWEENCLPWGSSTFPLPISNTAKIPRGAKIEGLTTVLQLQEVCSLVSVWCPDCANSLMYTDKKSHWIQDIIYFKAILKTKA